MTSLVGFGSTASTVYLYIANRPPIDDYPTFNSLRSLAPGEIAHIVKHTSHHWRKVFNVYAKLAYGWQILQGRKNLQASWQDCRNLELFQSQSDFALLFNKPQFNQPQTLPASDSGKMQAGNANAMHIVFGKTYANELDLPEVVWSDGYFATNHQFRLAVCPYPDYRQLSNIRIENLLHIMNCLK